MKKLHLKHTLSEANIQDKNIRKLMRNMLAFDDYYYMQMNEAENTIDALYFQINLQREKNIFCLGELISLPPDVL